MEAVSCFIGNGKIMEEYEKRGQSTKVFSNQSCLGGISVLKRSKVDMILPLNLFNNLRDKLKWSEEVKERSGPLLDSENTRCSWWDESLVVRERQ